MGKIRDIADRLGSVNIQQLTESFIEDELSDDYEDLIRKQLLAGKRGDNKDIEPEYSSTTYAATKPSDPERGFLTPNLKDTGRFHRSIEIGIFGDKVVADSSDSKADDLFGKYDPNDTLLNLRPKNKEIIGGKLTLLIIREIKTKL